MRYQLSNTNADTGIPSESDSGRRPQTTLQRILIVDDEPDMRLYMRRCLGTLKPGAFVILEASDGAEGLTVLRREVIHGVVCDVVMPRLDGLALCRALQVDEQLRHIPVLLVTGDRSAELMATRAEAAGARGLLQKPFNAAELVRALDRVLCRPPPE